MDSKSENQKISQLSSNLEWQYDIPDPVPGMCYIEPKLKQDFKKHDDSLEHAIPPTIHTNPLELFDIDYMGIILNSIENRECVNLPELKTISKEKDFDYQKYIQESFEDVNIIDHPHDKSIGVKEVYDVFPGSRNSDLQIIQTDSTININLDSEFKIEDCVNSNLYKKAVFQGNKYKCVKYKNSQYLLFEIEGDKIYFYGVDGIYRLTKE
ncbi:hypothetical protein NGRA_0414 [Nosema granulosis]|uniref:Uncharacterized protein n=1 Tax=Nosema granulosis TaxID=83296 RepID=A0A9P6H0Z4_9MICR|nr:hypothetical protein NGRA_0414 [Nosema granulosis]